MSNEIVDKHECLKSLTDFRGSCGYMMLTEEIEMRRKSLWNGVLDDELSDSSRVHKVKEMAGMGSVMILIDGLIESLQEETEREQNGERKD